MTGSLGWRQISVLHHLEKEGVWHRGCQWDFDWPPWPADWEMVRVLDSLVRRGLVEKVDDGRYLPVRGAK